MNHKRLDLEKNENEIGRSHFSKFSLCLLFLFSVIQTIAYSQTPWSAAKLDQTVVLLEKKVGDKYIPHGTAFIIVSYEIDTKFYLVTNKHLILTRF